MAMAEFIAFCFIIYWLYHNFTPKDVIFPISALLLKNPQAYDKSLEYFSTPLLSLIDS